MLHWQHNKIMIEYIEILKQTSLFNGIYEENIGEILRWMDARLVKYKKGEMIISEGSIVNDFGIVLSGHGCSFKQEISGKISIVTLLEPGSFIGILLAASRRHKSPVSVQAKDQLSVLFISMEKLICQCTNLCVQYDILIRNYIDSIAEKALVLHDRNDCLVKSTVREKILMYLRRMAKEEGNNTFSIPLDRRGMAEYINVERSALSRELSRMKKDGLIDYYKNSFKLL